MKSAAEFGLNLVDINIIPESLRSDNLDIFTTNAINGIKWFIAKFNNNYGLFVTEQMTKDEIIEAVKEVRKKYMQ